MKDQYKYFRWLSLDVVVGAIFFLFFLKEYYSIDVHLSVYLALASAVWLIYTTDHLIDARKVSKPSGARHQFHQRYFISILFSAGMVLTLALVNVYYLPEPVLRNGALLSSACVGYLMVVYFFKKLWVKELLVAAVYAIGIFLAPLTLTGGGFAGPDMVLVFQLTLIAFMNLMIFSFYDSVHDAKDGFGSLVLRLGPDRASVLIHSVALFSFMLAGILFVMNKEIIQLLYLVMTALLHMLHLIPRVYSVNERFRTVGDAVFYVPAIFLLLQLYW